MKSSRVFLIVFLPITLLILVAGEARAASEHVSSGFLAQGVVVFGLYGALIGAIVGGIVTGIYRVVSKRGKSPAPTPGAAPQ